MLTTTLTARQVGPCFAAEVEGVDMTKPLSPRGRGGDPCRHEPLRRAGLSRPADRRRAAARLHPEPRGDRARDRHEPPRAGGAAPPTTFADVSNLDKDDKTFARDDRRRLFGIGNRLWHSDSSFKVIPAKYSLLHACSLPSKGGNTEFADMRAAYDALDDETRAEVEGLVCEHSQIFSRQQLGFTDFTDEERERFKPVRQCLVRTHPVTRRKSLYLSSHAGGILGWPVPEARAFLRDLVEHATQREFVYAHRWRVGDLVMWDNRQTMHRARPFPAHEPRDMRRTTLAGDGPTAAQA